MLLVVVGVSKFYIQGAVISSINSIPPSNSDGPFYVCVKKSYSQVLFDCAWKTTYPADRLRLGFPDFFSKQATL